MQRALAVVDSDEQSREMVREAGELAAGVDADVVVLHVTTEEEFEDNQDRLAELSSEMASYGVETAQEGARQYAANVANELLSDVNVSTTAVGALGNRRDEVLDAARTHDCDYVFITGAKRSPTGKAIFGDDTQSIILSFEGSAVVRTK